MAERAAERLAMHAAMVRAMEGEESVAAITAAAADLAGRFAAGGTLLVFGNGGSAADAQHLAAELVGKFCLERRPFSAVALSDNVAAVTAVSNDYGYQEVFARTVKGLGSPGDVLVGISTSGRSENVINALTAARELGLVTVALVGGRGSPMEQASEHVLRVSGPNTQRIQEAQMLLGHTVFELVEHELCQP